MNFPRYIQDRWPQIVAERPPLVDVAREMETFMTNGKTGDVLNVSMPTRFGKSLLATSLTAWLLLRDPNTRILRASYSADLAEMFGVQVRGLYEKSCEDYNITIPHIEGTRGRWSIGDRKQPNHAGVGIGGGITGFGFDIAIVDDTAKNMIEATSAAYSRQLQVFKESVLLGRLEGRRKILNVGTRWTVNDWFSMWPDAEEYILPAMVDGHSVCEAWKTTAELELERSRVSDEVWNAQYMQRPTATGKVRLFEGWLPVITDDMPITKHVLVCDPATDYGSDFFVIGDYAVDGGLLYLCDMFADQSATAESSAEWVKSKDYSVAWVESNGVGAGIIDKWRRMGVRSVAGFSTTADKYSRAYVRMEDVKNYLRVCRTVPVGVVEELRRQADGFPVADHDDLIDNIVMGFERILRH
jgi:hypothetical protein